MDYTLYNAEELAADESFICYYLRTDQEAVTFWENWLRHHPEKIEEVLMAESLLSRLSLHVSEEEQADAMMRMQIYIGAVAKEAAPVVTAPVKMHNYILGRTLIAACGLLLFGVLLFLYSSRHKEYEQEHTAWMTYNNPPGQRMSLTLEDSTRVVMQAGSELKYRRLPGNGRREVLLDGEAFFDVKNSAKHPFTVYADSMQIVVLGTRFNLQHIDGKAVLALESGQVKVSAPGVGNTFVMHPGQQVTYTAGATDLVINEFNRDEVLGWKDGIVQFKDAGFKEIAATLQWVYGITLVNKSHRTTLQYTGSFRDAGYLSLIRSICYTTGLTYTISRDTICLH